MPLGEEQKRFIVDEVKRQVEPTHTLLQGLKQEAQEGKEWRLSFWSNGSGRPPGYFQNRVKSDDERYTALDGKTEAQSVILDEVKCYMIEQRAVRVERERAEAERRKRHARYWTVAKVVATALLGLAGWIATKAIPVAKILIEDYLKEHPYVSEHLKNRSSNDPDPRYADRQQSDLPTTYQR